MPVYVEGVRLANALTARWAGTVDGSASTAISGVGVWPLLAYLAAGAEGVERRELEDAVGADAGDAPGLATDLLALLRSMAGVRAALGIWVHPDVRLAQAWRAKVPADSCGTTVDPGVIDAWVREQTDGLIPRLSAPIARDALVALVMALLVRTRWHRPFTDDVLMPHVGPWAGRRVAGLLRSGSDRDDVSVLATPDGPVTVFTVEGDGDLAVDVLLGEPTAPAGRILPAVLAGLDRGEERRRGSELASSDEAPGVTVGYPARGDEPILVVEMPRFHVTAEHDLLARGELFGLLSVTDPSRQRFPRVSDCPLAVGAARQDVVAAFTAHGFEAAAVTQVSLAAGGAPPVQPRSIGLSVDRPFGFLARHRPSGLVLVAGWVADPDPFEAPENQRVQL